MLVWTGPGGGSSMFATLSCLLGSGGDNIAIAMFICFGVVGLVSVVAQAARKTREAGYNARLKQLMIERGMSAQEIDLVIRSKPDGCNIRDVAARWRGERL